MSAEITIAHATPVSKPQHKYVATCECGWTNSARTYRRANTYTENHATKCLRNR